MFLFIPLVVIAASLAGIGYIVWPKYKLVKNRTGLAEVREDFLRLLVPEVFPFVHEARTRFKILKANWALGYEKFLRRLKIISLKTDNTLNRLLENRPKPVKRAVFQKAAAGRTGGFSQVQFKTKESQLIAEIAKNPKDKNLYKALGALYLENHLAADAREVFNVVLELDPGDLDAKQGIEKTGEIV